MDPHYLLQRYHIPQQQIIPICGIKRVFAPIECEEDDNCSDNTSGTKCGSRSLPSCSLPSAASN